MSITNAALDAVADCLESGDTLFDALGKVAIARGAAGDWAQRVRRSVRPHAGLAGALRESNVFDDDELSLLLSAESAGSMASALRVVTLRRRRSLARRRALRWGLVVPFGLGALTVVVDPLPNLITGGAYVWPVLRGLSTLVVVTLAIVAGIPALLRDRRARPRTLRLCAAVPGVRRLTALYAEEELTTALAAFADGGELRPAGLLVASSLLAWSPLGEPLRMATRSVRSAPDPLPMGGLEPLAPQLSFGTDLAVIGGVALKRLADRLAQRGEAIASLLTARLRLVVGIGAYALVVLVSVNSVLGLISRGLPELPSLPGGGTSPEQKQLEDLLKQLEQ